MTRSRAAPPSDSDHSPPDETPFVLETHALLAQTEAFASRMALATQIMVSLTRATELDDALKVLAERLPDLVTFDHLSVCLRADNTWRVRVVVGQPDMRDSNVTQGFITYEPQLYTKGVPEGVLAGYGSAYITPLTLDSRNQLVGVLQLGAREPDGFTAQDTYLLDLLARQLAVVIRNAERYQASRAAQESLAKYVVQLEERNQELDAYSYTIAHDLKAPLNLIAGYSHLIGTTLSEDNAEAGEYLGHVNRAIINMSRMIDQLLFMARLDKQDAVYDSIDSGIALRNAIERFRAVIHERNIQVDRPAAMPQVCGYQAWVEEIFANLIGNAIKYIGPDNSLPCIIIRVKDEGAVARFEIEDNGIGIAPDDQKHLFERFTRINTISADGNGLGLAIVQRIITRLRGEVGVESAPGKGSIFWFYLPIDCRQSST